VSAGAEALMPPTDAFWSDRYAIIRDPFGHRWSLATQHEDLSTAELEERSDRWADATHHRPRRSEQSPLEPDGQDHL
jgi:hypothetical protein